MAFGYLKLFLIRRKTRVVPTGPLVDGVWRACADFQVRPPMVRAGEDVSSPFVASVCLPTLYVPQTWLEGGEPEMLDAICRHEIAHLAGRDLQWQLVQRICTILLWPHPLMWMISKAATLAGEQVCDGKVLTAGFPAKAYAESLLKLKDGLAFTRGLEPVGIGAVSIRSAFGKRIETIMKSTEMVRRELSRSGKLGLVLGSSLITALATTLIAAPAIKDAPVLGNQPEKNEDLADGNALNGLGTLTGWRPCIGREGPEYIIPTGMKSQLLEGFNFGKDTSVLHDGKPSAAFAETATDKSMLFRGLAQVARAEPYRGKRIRLTGYLKTKNTTSAGINIEVLAMDHLPAIDYMMDRPITGTTDWAPYSCVVDVPNDAVAIQLGAYIAGPGKAWASDFSIEVVDPSKVASTASKPGANVDNDIDKPENVDFQTPQEDGSTLKVPGWWVDNGDWKKIVVDRSNGSTVVSVVNDGKENWFQNGISQEILADHYRGKRIRFQALMKASGQIKAGTSVAVPGGGIWANTEADLTRPADAKGWRKVSTVADIPQWATCFQFGVFASGAGKASFTDCSLEIVDPNTPLTQDPPQPNFTKKALEALSPQFVNLNFQN
jgi:hypothetical protein